jgi:SAM-dependent methyltransferase
MRPGDRYILRVLAEQWTPPARIPSLLDISRGEDGLAIELRAAGFRVTRLTPQDGWLESLGKQLAGVTDTFDAICCRDVLERVDDWTGIVARLVRRLRPGGVLLYSVGHGGARLGGLSGLLRSWLGSDRAAAESGRRPPLAATDLAATLRRMGLLAREMRTIGGQTVGAADAATAAYVGYSVRRSERAAPATRMRWEFTGTGERWLAGLR